MKRIDWDGRLETGHAVIDTHHENLVQLFNQVVSVSNNRAGKLVCNEVLEKLIRHTREHFEFEELLMTQYHYPDKERHTAEHSALLRQVLGYRMDPNSAESRMPLIELGQDWLTGHMLTADKRLTGFLDQVVPPGTFPDPSDRDSTPPRESR